MHKKGLVVVMGLALLMSLSLVLFNHADVSALEVQLIRIHGTTEGAQKTLFVEPNAATVKKGGIVIWVNEGAIDEVKVSFEEGKKCADVTSATKAFNLEAACFVTTWIPLGGTTSLKFNEGGTFNYAVETNDGVQVKGKILVK